MALYFIYLGPFDIIFLPGKSFVGGYLKLGFRSVRHNGIYEKEFEFQEHCVGKLWVV
jgi:hypothetical protein